MNALLQRNLRDHSHEKMTALYNLQIIWPVDFYKKPTIPSVFLRQSSKLTAEK